MYDYYYQPNENSMIAERNKYRIKNLGFACGLAVIAFLVINNVIVTAVSLFGWADIYNNNFIFKNSLNILLSVCSVFIPFLIIGLSKKSKKSVNLIPFSSPRKDRNPVLVIFTVFAFCLIANFISAFIVSAISSVGLQSHYYTQTVSTNCSVAESVITILRIAVIPALVEEFAVRGVLMQALRKYGDMFAVFTSAFVFALMHGDFVQGIFAFVVGVGLGYAVVFTESIWTGIIIHFMNNLYSVLITIIESHNESFATVVYLLTNIVCIIFGIIFIAVLIVKHWHTKFYKPQIFLSSGKKFKAFIVNAPMIIAIILLFVNIGISVVPR